MAHCSGKILRLAKTKKGDANEQDCCVVGPSPIPFHCHGINFYRAG